MSTRQKFAAGILYVFILACSIPCTADSETLNLCGVDWPPWTYAENDRIVKGISFDMYSEAFRRIGLSFEAGALSWKRCIIYTEDMYKTDAVIDAGKEGRPLLNFGRHPTSFFPIAVYVRKDFAQEKLSWDLLRGKTVGMVSGYVYTGIDFDEWVPDYAVRDELVLKKLAAGRYDYALLDIITAPAFAEKLGMSVRALTPLVSCEPLYLAFNQKRKDVMLRFDEAVGKMIEDGTADTIYRKYLPYSYTELFKMCKDIQKPSQQW